MSLASVRCIVVAVARGLSGLIQASYVRPTAVPSLWLLIASLVWFTLRPDGRLVMLFLNDVMPVPTDQRGVGAEAQRIFRRQRGGAGGAGGD
jgi:hypothetical protein